MGFDFGTPSDHSPEGVILPLESSVDVDHEGGRKWYVDEEGVSCRSAVYYIC